MSVHICPKCYAQSALNAKKCHRCGLSFRRPLPVFWFMYMALLFVTYATLDFYHLV